MSLSMSLYPVLIPVCGCVGLEATLTVPIADIDIGFSAEHGSHIAVSNKMTAVSSLLTMTVSVVTSVRYLSTCLRRQPRPLL
jgi:hypothetical protein